MRLADDDLALRPYAVGDKPRLVQLGDNAGVSRYLTDRFPHPYRPEDADNWLKIAAAETVPCNFAIEWRGKLVGGAGLEPMTDVHAGTAGVGYWLGEPYWGNGLATRALALLTRYGLEELLFVRLQALVFMENTPSMRVLEKNGYVREGVMRKHIRKRGVIYDAALYAILRNG